MEGASGMVTGGEVLRRGGMEVLPLEHVLVSLEEERVMQQNSISISLSF